MSIEVDADNVVVNGNMTLAVAKAIGIKEVPVEIKLSTAQIKILKELALMPMHITDWSKKSELSRRRLLDNGLVRRTKYSKNIIEITQAGYNVLANE